MKLAICVTLLMGFSATTFHGLTVADQKVAGVKTSVFGKLADGREAHLYTLSNTSGMQVDITDFGATVVSIKVPDRHGNIADVILGYDTLDGYVTDKPYFGATVGRYGNRIANAAFSLDGKTFTLAKNSGENSLHGGIHGFNKALWSANSITPHAPSVTLNYLSKDGEEGFPGNLSVTVTFTLTNSNELKIAYAATTDQKTVVNLTNHSYFNLAGSGSILDHQLTLHASRFNPVNAFMIPTGELRPVDGTPFDFRQPKSIGARIDQDDEQLRLGNGYDHNFVLDSSGHETPSLAATVYDPASGRVLDVLTTEPGLQLYTANFLDGTIHGKGGAGYPRRSAFCLETQHFPDSPNHPGFPSTTLAPGAKYRSVTIYKFSVR
jgi:aldose 1-epimerase